MAVRKLEPAQAPKDTDEEAALDRAAEALRRFMEGGGRDHRSLAAVAISEWVLARTKLCAAPNFNARLMFDLGDARLRGLVETALPAIGKSVLHIPADLPFFELSQEQAIDLFVAGIKGAREAQGAAGVSAGMPFSDAIPFGD